MPFDQTVTRVHSGNSLYSVQTRLLAHVAAIGVVDSSQVWPVLDDEVTPSEFPSQSRFVTVRLPSLTWEHGDAMVGGGDVSEFIVSGQTRVTLWLRNELDYWGKVDSLMKEGLAPPPDGTKLIGRLVRGLHNTDVLDLQGRAILKQPLQFVSYEPPAPVAKNWHPFRLSFDLHWHWDLAQEVL